MSTWQGCWWVTLWGSPNKQTVSHRWHLLSAHSETPEERSDCCSSNYPVRENRKKKIRLSLILSNHFLFPPPFKQIGALIAWLEKAAQRRYQDGFRASLPSKRICAAWEYVLCKKFTINEQQTPYKWLCFEMKRLLWLANNDYPHFQTI